MLFLIPLMILGAVFIFLEVKRDKSFFNYDRIVIPLIFYFLFFPAVNSARFFVQHPYPMKQEKYSFFEKNSKKITEAHIYKDALIYKLEKEYFVSNAHINVVKDKINTLDIEKKFYQSNFSEVNPFLIIICYLLFYFYCVAYFKKNKSNISLVKLKDVIGLSSQKAKSKEILNILSGDSPSKSLGFLFEGPPGLGKTHLAQALANEAGVFFQNVKSSTLENKWVGSGSQRLQEIFNKAQQEAPSIIFFDEFDAIGAKRAFGFENSKYYNQSINTFLQCMNNVRDFNALSPKKVVVIAATNHMNQLDPAVVRSGRFDEKIKFTYPSINDRIELLKHYLPKNSNVDHNLIAKKLVGFTPADIDSLINKAKNKHSVLDDKTLTQYIMDIAVGEKVDLNISNKDLERTAIHESGHALVAYLCDNISNPSFVSIQPRGQALGITANVDDSDFDKVSHSKKEFEEQIMMLFGGQIAENVLLEDISSGASNDIERATDLAKKMVYEYGMSDLGMVKLDKDLSSQKANEYVLNILRTMQEKTKKMLQENKELLRNLSDRLLEEKEISKDLLIKILSKNEKSPQ